MRFEYRGHLVCLVGTTTRSAEVIEAASGARLPTKVTAGPQESTRDLAERARSLVDLYLGDESSGRRDRRRPPVPSRW